MRQRQLHCNMTMTVDRLHRQAWPKQCAGASARAGRQGL